MIQLLKQIKLCMQIKGKARKYCKAGRGAQYVFRSVENIGQEYGRVDGRQNEG